MVDFDSEEPEPEEDLDSEDALEEIEEDDALEDAEQVILAVHLMELLSQKRSEYGYHPGYFSGSAFAMPSVGERVYGRSAGPIALKPDLADVFMRSYKGRHESSRVLLNHPAEIKSGGAKIREYKKGINLINRFVQGGPSPAPLAELDQ